MRTASQKLASLVKTVNLVSEGLDAQRKLVENTELAASLLKLFDTADEAFELLMAAEVELDSIKDSTNKHKQLAQAIEQAKPKFLSLSKLASSLYATAKRL